MLTSKQCSDECHPTIYGVACASILQKMELLLQELGKQMTMRDISWHAEGNCSNHPDPDLWHYQNSMHSDEQELQVLRSIEAISLCRVCPVKDKCLEEGLRDENIQFWGGSGTIWGGLLTSQRYKLRGGRDNEQIVEGERRHSRNVKAKLAKLYG